MVTKEQASSFMARIQEKKQRLVGLGKVINLTIVIKHILKNI
jgi:hypothetical protein